jgi:murein DD-endopeptidase MepM/ murein hydrolase activator NlpD
MRVHIAAVSAAAVIAILIPAEASATGAAPSAAPSQPSNIKSEHIVFRPGTRSTHAIMSQEPSAAQLKRAQPLHASPLTAAPLTSTGTSGLEFLTRPYVSWHSINSVFDHCNPDYTLDNRVCRFDGTVAQRSNGIDPSFSSGYAMTPGGGDYLYYDGHNGWDYGLAYENVLAAADGTVTLAGTDAVNPCFGQTIIIDHHNGFSTRYAHLSQFYVSAGQSVTRGQIIAQSGNTGCSSGPHLHFGVYISSSWTAIDPWGWQGTGSDPWPSDPGNLWLTDFGQYPIPWAPGNVTVQNAGGTSAAVSWSAPAFDGGTNINIYQVVASPGGITATVPGGTTSATVVGLTAGATYTFTVTAGNQVGYGAVSAPSNPITITPNWAASYDVSGVARAWAVNQTQSVTVKITNTGIQTWPAGGANPVHLGVHFAGAPGGWPNQQASGYHSWVTDQRFALPSDVAPGSTATMTIPVTAPSTTAPTVVEVEMVKEGQLWFGDWSPTTVRIAPPAWGAYIDAATVPRNWSPGQTQVFGLLVKNTGSQTWPAGGANPVHLGVHFTSAAGGWPASPAWSSDQRFGLGADVPPGATAIMVISVTAPGGNPPLVELEMVKEQQFWFDTHTAVALSAGPPIWAASIDLSSAPRTWSAKQTQTFPVTITNVGNQVWPAAGGNPVHLGLHFASSMGGWPNEQASGMVAWLTDQRVTLPSDVPPSASVTWNVIATAPAVTAPVLEAEMVKEQQFWFKDWTPVSIAAAPAVWSSSFDLSSVPQNWSPGQTQSFTVNVTNNGNQTWPATGPNPVHLGVHFASSAGGWPNQTRSGYSAWLTDTRIVLPADVPAGGTAAVTMTLTAPAGSNDYLLEFELVKEQQFWFNNWTSRSLLNGAAVWAAAYDVSATPWAWSAGQAQTFSIRLTNNGNQNWSAGGANPVRLAMHFASSPGGFSNNAAWLSDQRVNLPADVAPGGSVTVPVTVTAAAGSLVLEAELVKENQFWFGDWASAGVGLGP